MKNIISRYPKNSIHSCAIFILLLFLGQDLYGQPLYKHANAFMNKHCIYVCDTMDYYKRKVEISYLGFFRPLIDNPDTCKSYDAKEMKFSKPQPECFRREPEYIKLTWQLESVDDQTNSNQDERKWLNESFEIKVPVLNGKAEYKATHLLYSAKDNDYENKDIFVTIDFRVNVRNMKKNYAKTSFSTKRRNKRKAIWQLGPLLRLYKND